MRQTKQKGLINEELSKFSTFFTAEELFDRVRKNNPRIGLATIYRFLKHLSEKKEIHSYSCNRRTIYSKEENSHCHFICQKCGRIIHFEIDSIDFLSKKINGDICHFQIDVNGVCRKCLNKKAV